MDNQEIFSIIEAAFNEHVSADGWSDHGTPMATITGKEDFLNEVFEKLKEVKKKSTPFDFTFPTRLKHFVNDIKANCAMGQEEQEYINRTSAKLLEHQIRTATDPHEVDYLNRLHKK